MGLDTIHVDHLYTLIVGLNCKTNTLLSAHATAWPGPVASKLDIMMLAIASYFDWMICCEETWSSLGTMFNTRKYFFRRHFRRIKLG